MADDDEAQAREKIAEMVGRFQEASEGRTVGETQVAIGNLIASMALGHHEPEVTVLTTIEIISEVYRRMRRMRLEGKQTGIVN